MAAFARRALLQQHGAGVEVLDIGPARGGIDRTDRRLAPGRRWTAAAHPSACPCRRPGDAAADAAAAPVPARRRPPSWTPAAWNASKQERRVSIAQLLFDHDPRIGEARTDRPIHRGVGRRHAAERADHHPERWLLPIEHMVDARRQRRPALPARSLRIGRTERCRVAPIIDQAAGSLRHDLRPRGPTSPPPSRAAWQGRARRGRFPAAHRAAAAGWPSTTPPIGAAAIGRCRRAGDLLFGGLAGAGQHGQPHLRHAAGRHPQQRWQRASSPRPAGRGVGVPRSLMRTSTERPVSRSVSRAMAGSCSVACAAVSAPWPNISPFVVSGGWLSG